MGLLVDQGILNRQHSEVCIVSSGYRGPASSNTSPGVLQGWEWLEEDWHIDMGGHEDACVDDEGWCYAVDFNWFRHPPLPGSGRFRRVRSVQAQDGY